MVSHLREGRLSIYTPASLTALRPALCWQSTLSLFQRKPSDKEVQRLAIGSEWDHSEVVSPKGYGGDTYSVCDSWGLCV